MEAKKSGDMPSASCRSRKVTVVIQWVWRPKKGLSRGLWGEDRYPSARRHNLLFLCFLFHLGLQWIRLNLSTLVRVALLYSVYCFGANVFQKYAYRHNLKLFLPAIEASLSSVKWTYKINHPSGMALKPIRTDSRNIKPKGCCWMSGFIQI